MVRVAFVLIFAIVQLCTVEYVEKGRKMILKDNLSLNPNRCHHPLITCSLLLAIKFTGQIYQYFLWIETYTDLFNKLLLYMIWKKLPH